MHVSTLEAFQDELEKIAISPELAGKAHGMRRSRDLEAKKYLGSPKGFMHERRFLKDTAAGQGEAHARGFRSGMRRAKVESVRKAVKSFGKKLLNKL